MAKINSTLLRPFLDHRIGRGNDMKENTCVLKDGQKGRMGKERHSWTAQKCR